MATWDEVRRLAMRLPETSERASRDGLPQWRVKDKMFVWERPLRRSDEAALTALGAEVPTGPVLGVRVADEGVKAALVADDPDVFFTIPHFDGYAAVLVRLDRIGPAELAEVVTEAWLVRATRRLAQSLRSQGPGTG